MYHYQWSMLVYRVMPDSGIIEHHMKYTEQNCGDERRVDIGPYCSQEPIIPISFQFPFSNVRLVA